MALIQILLSWLGRSSGKLLNAVFGWAVIALFGRSSSRQQTLLSAVVAMAVVWPLLVIGVFAPRAMSFVIALLPVGDAVPEGVLRIVWFSLALLVPVVVGLFVAGKAPPGRRQEPFLARLLRGFPVTVALAVAFLIMFVTVPALRIASALRGRTNEHVPLITEAREYDGAAQRLDRLIEAYGLGAARARPPWWMSAPNTVLKLLGRGAFRSYMPEDLAFWAGEELQVALYNSDVLIRGPKERAAWTHGLVVESFARGPGLQTSEPEAQELERQVHRVWSWACEQPEAHRHSPVLERRVVEMARELGSLTVGYDDWQIVYRKIGQLARAIGGETPLLQAAAEHEGGVMRSHPDDAGAETRPLQSVPTGELLRQVFHQVTELFKKELELARTEISHDLRSVVARIVGFALAGVFAILGIGFLGASIMLALIDPMPAWLAALIVAVGLLAVALVLLMTAKSKKVKPLERTQKTLKEDVQWAKERMA